MATLYRLPSGRFRAQIKAQGIRESRSFADRKAAQRWAADREAQIEHEAGAGPAQSKTLLDVLTRYRDEVTPTKRGARVERTRIDAMMRHYPDLAALRLVALTPERYKSGCAASRSHRGGATPYVLSGRLRAL